MPKTVAILNVPDSRDSAVEVLLKMLKHFMETLNLNPDKIKVADRSEMHPRILENNKAPNMLIIGWGLSDKPRWSKWSYEINTSSIIKIFIAIDLYHQHGSGVRVLIRPKTKGCNWRHKSWQTRCKLFLDDCFISYVAPYGMQRITKSIYADGFPFLKRYTLIPGSQQEIEIVRLIFNLFVDHGYTLTEIANLLNAQGVEAPNKSKIWSGKKLKSLMTSAVYIGSNQYGACVKHDVFPALIDRPKFCAAQAKIYKRQLFSDGSTDRPLID
jgi:hypothetical protein